ncbi:hypothetical protein F4802DRAFT_601860 [Xylaria palmicola]|nr:hypothetical protein F4802DRAFT_601860 [Xylaria palmicola]
MRPCGAGGGRSVAKRSLGSRQNEGESCPLLPGDDGQWHTIDFTDGPRCGGDLCTGFYCTPNPTGVPPDYRDPKDPNANNPVPTTTIEPPPGPTSGPTSVPTPTPTCDDKCKLDKGNACNCDGGGGGGGGGGGTGQPPGGGGGGGGGDDLGHGFIVIALDELYTSTEIGGDFARWWDVFAAPPDGQIDLCFDHAVKSEVTTTGSGASPGFPFTIGPFEAQGYTCTYEGEVDKLGGLKCDGVQRTECQSIEPAIVDECPPFFNPVLYGVVLCQF